MKGYWYGYLANGRGEWSETATSTTNTAITVTHAAQAGKTHYITSFEVALHGGSNTDPIEITLLDGATVIWRTSHVGNEAAVREHAWPHGLGATEGNSVSVTVAAAGVDVVADANLSGFTR